MRNVSTPALHTSIRGSINMQIREAAASQQNANALHNYAIQREQQQQRDMQTRFAHVTTFRLPPSAFCLLASNSSQQLLQLFPLPLATLFLPWLRTCRIGGVCGVCSLEPQGKTILRKFYLKERSNRILTLPVNNFLLGILL